MLLGMIEPFYEVVHVQREIIVQRYCLFIGDSFLRLFFVLDDNLDCPVIPAKASWQLAVFHVRKIIFLFILF